MSKGKEAMRPVRCFYCGEQMHYLGQLAHEPEVRLSLQVWMDEGEIFYLHVRCWNEWIRLIPVKCSSLPPTSKP